MTETTSLPLGTYTLMREVCDCLKTATGVADALDTFAAKASK